MNQENQDTANPNTAPTQPTVTVYSTSWCPDCHRAKAFLDARGIAYQEIDIDETPGAKDIVAAHNDGKHRVPTFDIDGQFYGNPPLSELEELLGTARKETEQRQVVILGSGPAGFTAALYAARADLDVLVLRGAEPGGQLSGTPEIENYPGFPEALSGTDLMALFEAQASRFGAELRYGHVTGLDLSERPYRLTVDDKQQITADVVILSTGASAKTLGLTNEHRLRGYGVSYCATCDGAFFRDQEVAVVGGGDTAVEEALFLTRFATKVTVIHRRGELRASKVLQRRAFANPKIEFLWHHEVRDVLGDERISSLQLEDTRSGETSSFEVGGLFVAIGHTPNTDLVRDALETDSAGYVLTEGKSTRTSLPGVFACGDVQDPVYRQAVTAAGSGAAAALDAEQYLGNLEEAETPGAEAAAGETDQRAA